MNIYALFPLIATVVYIPLLVSTISSRPWRQRQTLFALFLVAAMTWSLTDYFFRSNLFPEYNFLLLKVIVVLFSLMAVQLHFFTSSFFSPGQGRWLPFAYVSLAFIIVMVMLGYAPEGVMVDGNKLYPDYGNGIFIIAIPLFILLFRNLYVFRRRLKVLDSPVLYNQIVSLMITLFVLPAFTLAAFLPFGKEFPISHFGNIVIVLILNYATVRHQLLDIRFVLRRGLSWISLGVLGAASYSLLFFIFHIIFEFEMEIMVIFAAIMSSFFASILVYKLRKLFFVTIGKAFQGQTYDYRQNLADFANKIHNIFSLREQGGELLMLVTKAFDCNKAGLLLAETGSEDFTAQLFEPNLEGNPLSSLRFKGNSPIVEYLRREHKLLTRQNLDIMPEFCSLWQQEREAIEVSEIELFIPLISRDRLIGIIVLDKSQSGRFSLQDFNLLEDVTNIVGVSIEKEYLREQLRQRGEELSVINRSTSILTSNLEFRGIYDSFIQELKKAIDVSWSVIALIEGDEIVFFAFSSDIGPAWLTGERISIKGTGAEWVAINRKSVIESDITKESRFTTGQYHIKQGVRSVAYLPLIVKDEVIGSLIVASCYPNAYTARHMSLLEQLTSQIATHIENSRLYAKVEQRARIDELTGLLNRRSLDEMMGSEIGRHSRYGGVFSLAILDLDSFKEYNDKYGHLAGDKILRKIGDIMKRSIRNADQAFRYGGDEFAIILPQTSVEIAFQVAERVRKRIASEVGSGRIQITASLGMASWPADGIESEAIIAAADAALYQAKRGGGNRTYRSSVAMLLPDIITTGDKINNDDDEALNTIYNLSSTVDARDHYTRSHSEKVRKYTMAIAETLNMEQQAINKLGTCALLHDVGKIGISDDILSKKQKLTTGEWEEIRVHPQLGASIVSRVPQLAYCAPGILHHHERYDGSGYPKGLKGEEIPLEARILAIADAFASMTSDRFFSKTLSYEEALEEIKRCTGSQFDPNLVEAFLSLIESKELVP